MSSKGDGWTWRNVIGVMSIAAILAVALMFIWGHFTVDPWAAREHSYAIPGAYGDAFAPVVGLLTALALGAAVASVFMQRAELELQRKEMREAREQWTAQAAALKEANQRAGTANSLAAHANHLAWYGHTIEIAKQINELDAQAIQVMIMALDRQMKAKGALPVESAQIASQWFDYVEPHEGAKAPFEHSTAQLEAMAATRRELKGILKELRSRQPLP